MTFNASNLVIIIKGTELNIKFCRLVVHFFQGFNECPHFCRISFQASSIIFWTMSIWNPFLFFTEWLIHECFKVCLFKMNCFSFVQQYLSFQFKILLLFTSFSARWYFLRTLNKTLISIFYNGAIFNTISDILFIVINLLALCTSAQMDACIVPIQWVCQALTPLSLSTLTNILRSPCRVSL